MKNKFLLLISILFLVLSTYSFSDMSFEEKEKFTKQLSNAIEKKDKQTIKTLTKKYINEYPNEDYPYEYLGTIYAAEENYKEAEKYLLKAIELGNKDTAIISLAFVYLDQEKDKKADEILKNCPEQGYLTISNALQWRLQYSRVIALENKIIGVKNYGQV